MKTIIKINPAPRYNGVNKFLSDKCFLNTRFTKLSEKMDLYKYVKTKFIFLTLHFIDLLYIIYK